MLLNKARNYK